MFPELEVDKIILEKNTKNMEINEELGGRNLKKEFKFQDEEMNSNQKVVLRESGIQISNKGNFLFVH